MDPTFYTELPENGSPLRFLTVLPPEDEDAETIKCTLTLGFLESFPPPEYEALSYAWGIGPDEHSIIVNGLPFQIRENLMLALQHLRLPNKSRTLWIDAICINQADLFERSQQVSQMHRTFAGAECVLVWVGVKSTSSDEALQCFNKIIEVRHASTSDARRSFSKYSEAAVIRFLKRSWFTRLWVIQEVFFAKKSRLICGYDDIDFQDIIDVWLELHAWFEARRELYYSGTIFRIIRTVAKQQLETQEDLEPSPFTLRVLLDACRRMRATDARDRVFAVLNLAGSKWSESGSQLINHHKNVVEVYIDAATSIAKREETLHILHLAGDNVTYYNRREAEDELAAQLPSWVPDWSRVRRINFLDPWSSRKTYKTDQKKYGANPTRVRRHGCTNERRTRWRINGRSLRTNALRLGQVARIGLDAEGDHSRTMLKQVFQDAREIAFDMGNAAEAPLPERFVRTLAGNRIHSMVPLPSKVVHPAHTFEDLDSDVGDSMKRIIQGRVFITLGDGSIGIGPQKTQVGDIVFVLPRFPLPVVLREVHADGLNMDDIEGKLENLQINVIEKSYRFLGGCCK